MKVNIRFLLSILVVSVMMFLLVAVGCASPPVSEDLEIPVGGLDSDKDGLVDQQEVALVTDPNNPDTDGDGLKDGIEVSMGLDPKNPDTDGDGVPDADDFLPKFNNNTLYLIVGIFVIVMTCTVLYLFHKYIGLTAKQKEAAKSMRAIRKEEEATFLQVRDKIIELAKYQRGWLTVADTANELAIDPELVVKYFAMLKTRKKGEFYQFPDIDESFAKKQRSSI